jgi:hypothetical protein
LAPGDSLFYHTPHPAKDAHTASLGLPPLAMRRAFVQMNDRTHTKCTAHDTTLKTQTNIAGQQTVNERRSCDTVGAPHVATLPSSNNRGEEKHIDERACDRRSQRHGGVVTCVVVGCGWSQLTSLVSLFVCHLFVINSLSSKKNVTSRKTVASISKETPHPPLDWGSFLFVCTWPHTAQTQTYVKERYSKI